MYLSSQNAMSIVSGMVQIPRSNVVDAYDRTEHSATLFLFHGSGGTGEDFKQWLDILNKQELKYRHIKIVYPTAPIQLYTPKQGSPSHVWFNRHAVSMNVPEMKHSIDLICNKVSELIHREVASGIPINRIMVGGFSMGGCLAMHLAYRFKRSLAGCVAMSSFLNNQSYVYQALQEDKPAELPELLQFHGSKDPIVPIDWATKSFNRLRALGVNGKFITLDSVEHELVHYELQYFKSWLLDKLPK